MSPPPVPLHTAVWETSIMQMSYRGFPLCPNTLLFVPRQAGLAHQIQGHLHGSHHRERSVSPAAQPHPLAPTPGSGGTKPPPAAQTVHLGQRPAPADIFVTKNDKNVNKKGQKAVRASCAAGHLCCPRSKPRSDAGPFPSQSKHQPPSVPQAELQSKQCGAPCTARPCPSAPWDFFLLLFVQSLGKTAAGAW